MIYNLRLVICTLRVVKKRGWLIKNPVKSIGFIQITKKAEFHREILLFIVNELPKKDSGVDRLRAEIVDF